jgi:hypothetical protein
MRIGLLMLAAALLLGWLAVHTEIFYTDGLRYIAQARTIDQGSLSKGLLHSVDHPVYPLGIVAIHKLSGGDLPRDWQVAAQLAAVISGVLLVIPIYLISIELFGASRAWVACLFVYIVPFNGHVLADALSESTFLLFWSVGVWSSLRLLRSANLAWLMSVVIASALAYLTRPEGLVILLSLLATLCALPFWRSLEFPVSQARWALGLLIVGGMAAAGPFMVVKGGISSKPSMSRLLGRAPKADAMAVERERPLEEGQSTAKTVLAAIRALARAVSRAATIPVLLLAPLGILAGCATSIGRRMWLYLGIMLGLCALALIRVHMLAGYCTPRHAMALAWILTIAGGAGLAQLAAIVSRMGAKLKSDGWVAARAESAIVTFALAVIAIFLSPALTAPIDSGFAGYREAGEWLSEKALPTEHVIDPKGLALFYANETGYTFARLSDGAHDPNVRWLVAHDALLHGPWNYCTFLRELVGERRPAQTFPLHAARGASRVYVFDISEPANQAAVAPAPGSSTRR